MQSLPHRTCNTCKQPFPLTSEYWHKNKRDPEGLCRSCKPCAKQRSRKWIEDNRERSRKQKAEYRSKSENRDRARERAEQWRKDNPGRHDSAFFKVYYERDKSKRTAQAKAWAEANPEKIKQIKRDYITRNPQRRKESANAYGRSQKGGSARRNRRARVRAAEGTHTAEDIALLYQEQEGRCGYCGITLYDDYHVDHMIPIVRGGSNGPENLLVTCMLCNSSKCDKTPEEWEAVRGW